MAAIEREWLLHVFVALVCLLVGIVLWALVAGVVDGTPLRGLAGGVSTAFLGVRQ